MKEVETNSTKRNYRHQKIINTFIFCNLNEDSGGDSSGLGQEGHFKTVS